jgi:beta-mannanase
MDMYKTQAGVVPAIAMDNLNWGTQTIDTSHLDAIIARGSMPMIMWEPGIGDNVSQPQFALRTIAAGADDSWMTPWAHQLAVWDKTVYIRFAHEMNGWWAPWCVGVNGNTSADFVSAWRHVVDLFRSQGATNVKWVWSPNIDIPGQTASLASVYPGDSYVDWVGLDGYNWGTSQPGGTWQSFSQVFGASYQEITALTNKPLMIAETASTEMGGDKAAWIRSAFLSELPASFPRIRAVVWWDKAKETNWQFDSSSASQNAFRTVATSPGYTGRLP